METFLNDAETQVAFPTDVFREKVQQQRGTSTSPETQALAYAASFVLYAFFPFVARRLVHTYTIDPSHLWCSTQPWENTDV